MLASAIGRGTGFFVLWLVLDGGDPAALPVGLAAAAAATWASLRLLPPAPSWPAPIALAGLAGRFLRQSIVAGVDIAFRALDPRLPLRPGFVTYRLRLPEGTARAGFCALSSLFPGSLPCGADADGVLLIHCLDTRQAVAAQFAAEEASFIRALRADPIG